MHTEMAVAIHRPARGHSTMATEARALACEIQSEMRRTDNMHGLVQWIETARRIIDGVQHAAGSSEAVRAALREHVIPYNHAWESRQSEALLQLTEDIAQSSIDLGSRSADMLRALAATKEANSHAE